MAAAAGDSIVAGIAQQNIVTAGAIDHVVAKASGDEIKEAVAIDDVVALFTKRISCGADGDRVIPMAAKDPCYVNAGVGVVADT